MKKSVIVILLPAIFCSILTQAKESKSSESATAIKWLGDYVSSSVLHFPVGSKEECLKDYSSGDYDKESGHCYFKVGDANQISIKDDKINNKYVVKVSTVYGPANQRSFNGEVTHAHFGSNGITSVRAVAVENSEASQPEEGDVGAGGGSDCRELKIELSNNYKTATVITNLVEDCDSHLGFTATKK